MKKNVIKIVAAALILAGSVGILGNNDTHTADPGGGGRIIPTSVKVDM
ncbi:hypothetical protein [Bacillus infantis]|nr:hypothetical protein [Bacillus infantis]